MVQLSYSQTRIVADALEPLVRAEGNRPNVAKRLGVKDHIVQKILARKAATRIAKTSFALVAVQLGLDTASWDIATCNLR